VNRRGLDGAGLGAEVVTGVVVGRRQPRSGRRGQRSAGGRAYADRMRREVAEWEAREIRAGRMRAALTVGQVAWFVDLLTRVAEREELMARQGRMRRGRPRRIGRP
jgi:hypothetical protein